MENVLALMILLLEEPFLLKRKKSCFYCLSGRGEAYLFKWMGHDYKSRSYFTTEDTAKVFLLCSGYGIGLEPGRWLSKLMVVKKILLGGDVDKIEDEKPAQLFYLIPDYKKFFHSHMKGEIPFFYTILATGQKSFYFSCNEFEIRA